MKQLVNYLDGITEKLINDDVEGSLELIRELTYHIGYVDVIQNQKSN